MDLKYYLFFLFFFSPAAIYIIIIIVVLTHIPVYVYKSTNHNAIIKSIVYLGEGKVLHSGSGSGPARCSVPVWSMYK